MRAFARAFVSALSCLRHTHQAQSGQPKRIWPHRQRARLSAGFFRSSDMLFTKCSQNGAQIERTKGFDPIQRARHARAFCCQSFLAAKLENVGGGKSQRKTFLWTKKMDLFSEIHF